MALTDYIIMPSADYTAACDKVRERTGKTDLIKSGDLAAEIEGIPQGGGDDSAENELNGYLAKTIKEAYLPTVTSIPENAFKSYSTLEKVTMPKVTSIGQYGFYSCSNLVLTALPSGLKTISSRAFYGCKKLSLTSLPSGLTSIGDLAFTDAKNAINVTELPDTISYVGTRALSGQQLNINRLPSALKAINGDSFMSAIVSDFLTIHAGITSIGSYGLAGGKYKWVVFEGTPRSINSSAFSTNCLLIRVPWAKGAVANAPWGATNATIIYDNVPSDVEINFTVDTIGYKAKEGMTWLEFVYSDYNTDKRFTIDSNGNVLCSSAPVTTDRTESGKVAQFDEIQSGVTYYFQSV